MIEIKRRYGFSLLQTQQQATTKAQSHSHPVQFSVSYQISLGLKISKPRIKRHQELGSERCCGFLGTLICEGQIFTIQRDSESIIWFKSSPPFRFNLALLQSWRFSPRSPVHFAPDCPISFPDREKRANDESESGRSLAERGI